MNSKELEKYSSAITLSDMEIFVFPELMYSLVLANIMSPILWKWRQEDCFKKLELGTKVFFYHKARRGGPVSDTTATEDSSCLGWEWDLFCNWRITSDLAWTMRYSMFQPGDAFKHGDRSCRQFLYTGMSLSF